MANNAYTQIALADDRNFLVRVRGAMLVIALQILAEDPETPNHLERVTLANAVLSGDTPTSKFSPFLVMRPNVLNFETSYDFASAAIVTASGDADLQSQINSDWNALAAL